MSASRKPQVVRVILAVVLNLAVSEATADAASTWYAAPWGTSTGDGSLNNPWDLQTALNHPAVVQAGDTIALRGGVYWGSYVSKLTGTPNAPIIVRSHTAEWARIDGGTFNPAPNQRGLLHIEGDQPPTTRFSGYTWYRDFEITSTSYDRDSACDPNAPGGCSSLPDDIDTTIAVYIDGEQDHPGLKFLNLVIHDTAGGYIFYERATQGAEIYGNVIYYNGWNVTDRGHGHGIYARNNANTGTKRIVDNIILRGYAVGIHAWADVTSSGQLYNISAEGNIIFDSGILGNYAPYDNLYLDNILIGDGPAAAYDAGIISNYTYYTPRHAGGEESSDNNRNQLGHQGYSYNARAIGNYFVAEEGWSLEFRADPNDITATHGAVITDNMFYGSTVSDHWPFDDTLAQFRDPEHRNTFYGRACYPTPCPPSSGPFGVQYFLRPNQYDSGRANIAVFNWDENTDVAVDVSAVLGFGDRYEVRDVQNYLGSPVASGIYWGGTISIPMGDESAPVAVPNGPPPPPAFILQHTPREFGAFVLIRVLYEHQNSPGPG